MARENPYPVLSVTPQATQTEITRAYRESPRPTTPTPAVSDKKLIDVLIVYRVLRVAAEGESVYGGRAQGAGR